MGIGKNRLFSVRIVLFQGLMLLATAFRTPGTGGFNISSTNQFKADTPGVIKTNLFQADATNVTSTELFKGVTPGVIQTSLFRTDATNGTSTAPLMTDAPDVIKTIISRTDATNVTSTYQVQPNTIRVIKTSLFRADATNVTSTDLFKVDTSDVMKPSRFRVDATNVTSTDLFKADTSDVLQTRMFTVDHISDASSHRSMVDFNNRSIKGVGSREVKKENGSTKGVDTRELENSRSAKSDAIDAKELEVDSRSANGDAVGAKKLEKDGRSANGDAVGAQELEKDSWSAKGEAVGAKELENDSRSANGDAVGAKELDKDSRSANGDAVGAKELEEDSRSANGEAVGAKELEKDSWSAKGDAVGAKELEKDSRSANSEAVGAKELEKDYTPNLPVVPSTPESDDEPGLFIFDHLEGNYKDFTRQVLALHEQLCVTSCYANSNTPLGDRVGRKGCARCFCDELCHAFNDCCPDKQLIQLWGREGETQSYAWEAGAGPVTCENSHVKSVYHLDYFSMINVCPPSPTLQSSSSPSSNGSDTYPPIELPPPWTKEAVRRNCENRNQFDGWRHMRPVTSSGGLVYRNQYCANCHGHRTEDLNAWTVLAQLRNAETLKQTGGMGADELYSECIRGNGSDVRFESKNLNVRRRCTPLFEPFVTTCNQTGQWRTYDPKVERACALFTSVVHHQFKNVFCYVCNENFEHMKWLEFALTTTLAKFGNVARVSFLALLDFENNGEGSPDLPKETTCDLYSIQEPFSCQCRPLLCDSGLMMRGERCVWPSMAHTVFLTCQLCMHVLVTAEVNITENVAHAINLYIHNNIQDPIISHQQQSHIIVDCNDSKQMSMEVSLKLHSDIFASMEDMASSVYETLGGLNGRHEVVVNWWSRNFTTINLSILAPAPNCFLERTPPDTCTGNKHYLILDNDLWQGTEQLWIQLLNTSFCSHVKLTKDEFLNFRSRIHQLGLSDQDFLSDVIAEDGFNATGRPHLLHRVCGGDLFRNITRDTCNKISLLDTAPASTWTALGVTSVVCTSVSLVSLLCVMVSYAALAPLRSSTGLSMLAMACLLFAAQALHEVGLEQYEDPWLCLVLALLIHWSWLAAVFMMTACTAHFFLALVFPLQCRAALHSGARRHMAASLAVATGLAAAVVGGTVSANYVLYGDPGYPDRYLCFIKRTSSKLLGFGLPVAVAIACNLGLFGVAVVHLHQRPRVSSTRQQQRVGLGACVRLSSMTGVSWLSLFLLAVPGSRPLLEYVSVALVALQGLLLAVTLLLNGRVLTLWRGLLYSSRGSPPASTVSSTASSANSRVPTRGVSMQP